MYSRCWLIIRDDSKKTYEICGQTSSDNHFTNTTHGMQKAGMNVSCLTPNVTNKNSSKELVKVDGYKEEVGLNKRLLDQYMAINRSAMDDW